MIVRTECDKCHKPFMAACERLCNDCKEKPAPVHLSAEMLGEEDRRMLCILKAMASFLASKHYLIPDEVAAVAWADRLLGSADDKGGE